VESSRDGLATRAGQARVVMSWRLGWRSRDEPARLARKHLTFTPSPRGAPDSDTRSSVSGEPGVEVNVLLPSSKTDQVKRGVLFALASSSPESPLARDEGVARVVQWACLVDAMRGSSAETPLFCSLRRHGITRAERALTGGEWRSVFNVLQRQAGLAGFTPHSTRVGFAVTAAEQGHSDVDIQRSMRLRTPEVVQRYTRQARNHSTPQRSLIRGLAAQHDSSGHAKEHAAECAREGEHAGKGEHAAECAREGDAL